MSIHSCHDHPPGLVVCSLSLFSLSLSLPPSPTLHSTRVYSIITILTHAYIEYYTMVQTRSRSSARHATPLPSSTSSLTVIPSSVSPRSHSLPPLSASQQPVKIKLTLVPDEENENVNTSMTVSSPSALSHAGHPSSLSLPASRRHLSAPLTSTTTDDDASDDGGGHPQLGDLDNDNDSDDEEEANQSMNGDNSLDSLGYPSKLPFWVSANLVVRHPSSKDKETCLACMQELKEQREALDSEADKESEDWKARSVALEEKSESSNTHFSGSRTNMLRSKDSLLLTTLNHLPLHLCATQSKTPTG